MSTPGGPPSRTGRHVAAYYADIPRTRAPKPVPIDLAAWARYERENKRANDEYALHPFAACSHRGHCRKEAS